MKRYAYAIATLPLFVLFASIAISNPPVRMAVLDGPVDYQHPEIQPVLDEDLLKNVKLTNDQGEEKTWFELNQEAKSEFERRLNQGTYKDQVEFLDHLQSMGQKATDEKDPVQAIKALGRVAKGLIRYAYSREFRSQLNLIGGYLHGTHVAGVAFSSVSDVRLINFPLTKPHKALKLSEILEFDPEKSRETSRKFYSQISRVLRENNVRIVNLSVEVTPDSAVKSLKNRAGIFARLALNTVYRHRLLEIGRTLTKQSMEDMSQLARENPQAVFIYAAGNSVRTLDQGEAHSAQIKEPNVIQVASIDRKGKRSVFSNWSGTQIEVAAVGTAVLGALVGGGKIYMSGTSMAAPKVSNATARVFANNPLLSATEAIQVFYDQHTVADATLADFTIGGRKLIELDIPRSKTLEQEVNLTSKDETVLAKLINNTVAQFSDDVDKIVLNTKIDGKLRGIITFVKNGSQIDVNIEDVDVKTCEAEASIAG